MSPDYKARVAAFQLLSDEDLSRPLWEIAPADRTAFLAARNRRTFARHSADEDFQTPEHDQRVTDWADTE
ncbi:hypothetical protein [Streptomyces sp. SP18CS02]|uniref:hypothetical protein n=1 Tax=Streptomyces sp. SP18CS02 TaxID=3002531 RepID=UPI002E7955EF|nr:hypothetical protein [Streptomyces sp. SP18CS02]MEE1754849.1 hypothetical protein [Streptomyces sp. SP18CS02]